MSDPKKTCDSKTCQLSEVCVNSKYSNDETVKYIIKPIDHQSCLFYWKKD
ncbi:MAG: hypothetical protein R8M45_10610 [Ghiorsea sp.]